MSLFCKKNIFIAFLSVVTTLIFAGKSYSHKIDFKVVPVKDIYPRYTPSLSDGKKVFNKNCIKCHDRGRIPENSADFWDVEEMRFIYTPFHYFFLTSVGRRKMPAFDYTEEEHWDVVFYIRSLSVSKESVKKGREIFSGKCAVCHSLQGEKGAVKADLSLQHWNHMKTDDDIFTYIVDTYQRKKGGRVKESILKGATEESVWNIVDYIRSLQYKD